MGSAWIERGEDARPYVVGVVANVRSELLSMPCDPPPATCSQMILRSDILLLGILRFLQSLGFVEFSFCIRGPA